MKNFLNYVSLRNKLISIAALAVVFVSIPVVELWQSKTALLDYTRQEMVGVPALTEGVHLLQAVQGIRKQVPAVIAGQAQLNVSEFQEQLGHARGADLVKQSPALQKRVQQLESTQAALQQKVQARQIGAIDAYNGYSALAQDALSLLLAMAGESGIILDPEAVTYYLFDISSVKLPDLVEQVSRMEALLAAQTGAGKAVDGETIGHLDELLGRAAFINAQLGDSVQVAHREQLRLLDEEMARDLDAGFKQLQTDLQAVETAMSEARKGVAGVDAQRPVAAMMKASQQFNNLVVELLGGEFEQRVARIKGELRQLAILMGTLVLVLFAGIWLIARSVIGPLELARRRSKRIATQDLSDDGIVIAGNNETIKLIHELDAMRQNLLESLTRERELALANSRVREALENTSTCVMIADTEGKIIYTNRAVMAMLAEAEADLRRDLPQFSVERVVGSNFDLFHRNPAHQRNLLAALQQPHKAQIAVGGRTFRLQANPIKDAAGTRLGTVVEWLDRTAEVAAEREVATLVQAAAQGDFTQRMNVQDKQGFFRQLGENINALLQTSEAGMNDVARMLAALAQGDLTARITAEYQGTFGRLKDDANRTSEQLREIVQRIRESTDAINLASQEIASGNGDLSHRTEQQASSLEETASSMEELTSTVKQNADNARQANQLAKGASGIAVKGGEVVANVVQTMDDINTSARKIVDIISVIDGIAFQTNILALNAAVEAARAGEQGRGFAVVAGEVRNLAQRSAAAAKEIKSLISDSVSKVDNGSRLVEQAGSTMKEIVDAVKRVTDIMSEIAAASAEQGAGIEQVNQAVTQMDESTQQNAALVEQAAAAAESLQEQAHTLVQLVGTFRLSEGGSGLLARTPSLPPAADAGRASARKRQLPASPKTDEWEEF